MWYEEIAEKIYTAHDRFDAALENFREDPKDNFQLLIVARELVHFSLYYDESKEKEAPPSFDCVHQGLMRSLQEYKSASDAVGSGNIDMLFSHVDKGKKLMFDAGTLYEKWKRGHILKSMVTPTFSSNGRKETQAPSISTPYATNEPSVSKNPTVDIVESPTLLPSPTSFIESAMSVTETIRLASQWPVIVRELYDDNTNCSLDSNDPDLKSRTISKGKCRWDINAEQRNFHATLLDTPPISNFYFTIETKVISTTTNGVDYGVIVKWVDNQNFYYLALSDITQSYAFFLYKGGQWVTLIPWTKSTWVRPNENNLLTLVSAGSDFLIFVNQHFVAKCDNTELARGKMGLNVQFHELGQESIIDFDNIEIRAP